MVAIDASRISLSMSRMPAVFLAAGGGRRRTVGDQVVYAPVGLDARLAISDLIERFIVEVAAHEVRVASRTLRIEATTALAALFVCAR